jgi:S1-C subfamily serine protease
MSASAGFFAAYCVAIEHWRPDSSMFGSEQTGGRRVLRKWPERPDTYGFFDREVEEVGTIMNGGKQLTSHVVTSLVTLGLVALWFGNGGRPSMLNQIGRRDLPATVVPAVPVVKAQAVPDDLSKRYDVEEQVNIRVYASVNKSVVNITTATEGAGFFGEETSSGTGSGFVIDKAGHILTNNHVIEGASTVQATLSDGSTHEAIVIGRDASNDVAVLQIKVRESDLSPVALGDSTNLLVGQKVLALGNPFGLERTLTTGIISSLDRSLKARNGRMIKGIIQTDAAINPGNSGGPLLNSRGEVIGMNTAIISQVGQSAGISFAVPINTIQRILKSLIDHGRVIRADLGLTRVYRRGDGLTVLGVTEGGPADRAGIKPMGVKLLRYGGGIVRRLDPESADVILAVDGKAVKSVEELLSEVESHAPGETVKLRIERAGEELEVVVKLGES